MFPLSTTTMPTGKSFFKEETGEGVSFREQRPPTSEDLRQCFLLPLPILTVTVWASLLHQAKVSMANSEK